ncbi:phage tail protein [Oceanibaculum sp.]|uniref:phage tail protein n=1 Tax=Oceanibaculum sp. TaxID=1903597 RepID=UPI002590840F|nr:tail fiber protein [Oceanibaculum sp.]MCH2395189.1 tail fiber protein [Oceanibaculum sp.]
MSAPGDSPQIECYNGEIRLFAGSWAPRGWEICDGTQPEPYQIFLAPDLQGRVPIGQGQGPGLSPRNFGDIGGSETVSLTLPQMPNHTHDAFAGGSAAYFSNPNRYMWAAQNSAGIAGPYAWPNSSSTPTLFDPGFLATVGGSGGNTADAHENMMPTMALNYIQAQNGNFPERYDGDVVCKVFGSLDDAYVGEVRLACLPFTPDGWLPCDGRLLPMPASNDDPYVLLFTILGWNFGGSVNDKTFGIPNLGSMAVMGIGQGPGLSNRTLGQTAGDASVTLQTNELPPHSHSYTGYVPPDPGDLLPGPQRGVALAYSPGQRLFSNADPDGSMAPQSIGEMGGGEAHENRQPGLTLAYFICYKGVYPMRSSQEHESEAAAIEAALAAAGLKAG